MGGSVSSGGAVLVVEYDLAERNRMAAWLESAGYEVMVCTGPLKPDYTCVGGRGGVCALADGADVVVLNLRLASDDMVLGTPGWQILDYYRALGKRVIALTGDGDFIQDPAGAELLPRPVGRDDLLRAVRGTVIDLDSFEAPRTGVLPTLEA